ncbi:MAG: LLM class flavin-dependent oxidoreductase [Acidimicrobiales bacterium]
MEQRRGIGFTPLEQRREVVVDLCKLADSLGYEAVQIPEGWGLDSTALIAEIAVKTEHIRPMSAIVSIYGRTPGTIAMSTATLADISGGRYVLGLGVSTAAMVEGFHDVEFDRPAKRLGQVASDVRWLLSGERANLRRDTAARPLRLGLPPVTDQEIHIAGLRSRTSRVAAEQGDGWMPAFIGRDRLKSRSRELLEVRAAAGIDDPFTVSAAAMSAVHDDESVARQMVATNLAFYITAMGYAPLLVDQGFGAEVEAVVEANPNPSPTNSVIPPEAEALLEQFAVYGDDSGVADQLQTWDQAADIAVIGLSPGQSREDLARVVTAAAPTK